VFTLEVTVYLADGSMAKFAENCCIMSDIAARKDSLTYFAMGMSHEVIWHRHRTSSFSQVR